MIDKKSELTVITKAKDLCSYIILVTEKSPKKYRFTFVSRLQNLAFDVIENLFRANEVFVQKGDLQKISERLEWQRKALISLKLIGYFAMLSSQFGCLLFKQYEQIAQKIFDCQNILGAWMTNDRKRLQP